MLSYCKKCVMPNSKPDLFFDDNGVCIACQNFDNREAVDWDARRQELLEIKEKYVSKDGSNWDCIVPVSGGKDSMYQVIKMLELGFNPLCVTSTTCDQSELGSRNIQRLKELGVDHIQMSPRINVRSIMNRIGLEELGDISWPEHVGIFTIPVRAAVQFNVPLIVWGENSQNEYGGPAADAENSVLNRRWLEEFGGLLGFRVSDLVDAGHVERRDVIPYFYPSDEELARVGVTGIFLGYYIPWDGLSNALISQSHGFETYQKSVEGSMVNYENLDNYQTGIHDYFKYLKFGFGRATDIACLHVRRGRITREEAVEIVMKNDGSYPAEYLGRKLEDILEPLGLTVEQFDEICDNFTNSAIFKMGNDGKPIKDKTGRPILLSGPGD